MKLTTTIDVQLGRGQNMREHYAVRAQRVKLERMRTAEALHDKSGVHSMATALWDGMGARITLHRPWARVPLDSDNLSGAFKGVRDEVAAFLGVDDKSERLHWIYTQSKQPKGTRPTVTIEVMPVQDIDPQAKRVRELEARVAELEGKEAKLREAGNFFATKMGEQHKELIAQEEELEKLKACLRSYMEFTSHICTEQPQIERDAWELLGVKQS